MLIFYATSGINKREDKNMSQQQELYTYCSMNKQYVEGAQKIKRLTWWILVKDDSVTLPFSISDREWVFGNVVWTPTGP